MTDGWSWERLGAVVRGDLRGVARQKTPFVLRTVYAALVAMGVLTAGSNMMRRLAAQGWSGESMAVLGGHIFSSIVLIQSTLATVLGVLLGVASMHTERQNKTLGLLVLSQLRSGEIVVGKFLASFGLVVTVLLAGLPVFALLGWVGGVDYSWLPWLALYTLVLAGLGAASGLYFGLRLPSAAEAAASALGQLGCLVLFAVPLWLGNMGCFGCVGALYWLPASIVLGVATMAQQQSTSAGGVATVIVGLSMATLFTLWLLRATATNLADVVATGPGRGLRGVFEDLDAFFESINIGDIRFNLGGDGSPRGNPVTWLTQTASGFGLPHYGLRMIVAAIILSLVALIFATEEAFWGQLLIAFWSLAAVGIPLTAGANAFGDEKLKQTLGVLLATPLSAVVILRGKFYVFLRLLLLLVIPAAFLILMMKRVRAHGADDFMNLSSLLVAEAFLAYFVALFFSLVAPSPLRAGVTSAAVLAALHALFGVAVLASSSVGSAWIMVRLALLVWIAAAGTVGILSFRRRPPAHALVALLAALVPALGLVPVLPYRPVVEVLIVSVFVFVFTNFQFDRVAGRSP